MKELTYDEYDEQVISPLFYGLADGFYEGLKGIAEKFGCELADKEECTRTLLNVWHDEEMYDWVPEMVHSLGIDVPCEDWSWE